MDDHEGEPINSSSLVKSNSSSREDVSCWLIFVGGGATGKEGATGVDDSIAALVAFCVTIVVNKLIISCCCSIILVRFWLVDTSVSVGNTQHMYNCNKLFVNASYQFFFQAVHW